MNAARPKAMLAAVALCAGLCAVAAAEETYDEFGLRPPDGGSKGDEAVAWPEPQPSGDGARPERIAPDEDALDPFDERAIELEPEVRIAPAIEPEPAPSREAPEPVLPPVEQVLREGPAEEMEPEQIDPGGMDDEQQQVHEEQADPQEW